MQTITTIGLDIAKSVFQVHGIDAGGQVLIRHQLKRRHVLTFFEKLPPAKPPRHLQDASTADAPRTMRQQSRAE